MLKSVEENVDEVQNEFRCAIVLRYRIIYRYLTSLV